MGLFGIVGKVLYIFNMSKNTEIWKPVIGYEGLYEVSSLGNVRSLWYGKKNMKLRTDKDGYLMVNFHKDKKQTTHKVHRLVAETFIPNPEGKPQIDHINTDKTDNRAENLKWVTQKENNNNPLSKKHISTGKLGKNRGKDHFASKSIIQFTKNNEFVKIWENAQDVAREWGLYSGANIISCCRGKLTTAYGFKWGYADDYERIPFKVFDLEIYTKKVA